MLSLQDIATVKFVIEICNNPDLKKEILHAPGSYYDLTKGDNDNELLWHEIVEKKARAIIENLGLTKQLQEKVTSIVFSVGMRMLLWTEYHESTLGLSREYSINFLKNSFFTPEGIIDGKKTAKELINDENLNTKQKFKLACLYCFTDHIPVLFSQMTTDNKKDFYDAEKPFRIKQPQLVKFWSYYLMSDVGKLLKGGKNIDQYRLEIAIRSGIKTAVEYCFEKTKLRVKVDAVLDAAMEAVRCRMCVKPNTDSDWIFRSYKNEESWVPSDYYVDILCFLLSKMGEDQQIEFFKEEIEISDSQRERYWRVVWCLLEGEPIERRKPEYRHCSSVLEYFLNWPHQDFFMKKAKLMWEFLPENDYAVILLMICDKIESKYGEEKSFDYKELLKEFWCSSPDRYKRHVFNNQEVRYKKNTEVVRVKIGVGLLIKLLTLKNFTYKDEEIIKLILANATAGEKENILSSKEWTEICVKLIKEEKWETLDRYILYFLSKEEESKFKREMSFRKKVQSVCIDFAKNDNWNAAEYFIKWSSLPEEEIKKLKLEMINSEYGWKSCVRQILLEEKKVKALDKFIRWYLPSEEEVKMFKKELILSSYGTGTCANFVTNKQELVTELINFCLSSEEEVRELKKRVAYENGSSACKYLIAEKDYNYESFEEGGKWEEVEKYLTWCFNSEEEISDFKKNTLLKECGEEIHFELIKSNQWGEAETFFDWLGLSVEEIKELKKRTLFNYSNASDLFIELIYSEENDDIFIDYGNKQEAIELFLRWYLTDKEMVLEYKDKFYKEIDEEHEDDLKSFDLMIEQRLRDLECENPRVKRTNETCPPNKRLCILKFDTIGAEYGK